MPTLDVLCYAVPMVAAFNDHGVAVTGAGLRAEGSQGRTMIIRQETSDDYNEVDRLVRAAFATTAFSDGTEADYLNRLRESGDFIPELSLVATEDSRIVGQIVIYQTRVYASRAAASRANDGSDAQAKEGGEIQLVLSPLSVLPSHFGRGLGAELIAAACAKAATLGYQAVFLCGDPDYYQRQGFVPSWRRGIYHLADHDKTAPWCLVRELVPGYLQGARGYINIV